MARRLRAVRHAAGLAGRRRHQLRDARARPAAARLRPHPPAGRRDRTPGRAGRGARDARPRAADPRPRRRGHHRRLRCGRAGRDDGRPDHRDRRGVHRAGDRGGALRRRSPWPGWRGGTSCPARRREAVRARRRPRAAAGRVDPGGPAARPSSAEPAHVGSTEVDHPRAARHIELDPARPGRTAGLPIAAPDGGAHADPGRLHGRHRPRTGLDGHPADLAARPRVPGRPRRGGHPAGRLRADPVGAAAGPARPRLRRAASGCAAGSAWPSRTPATSRRRATRSSAWPTWTRSAWPRTTTGATRSGWPTRSATASRCCAPPCCRGCSRRCGATSAGAPSTSRCSRSGRCSAPDPARCRSRPGRRSTGGRPTRRSPPWTPRCRPSRAGSPSCSPASRERAGWWGPGRAASWSDAVEAARAVAARGRGRGRRCAPTSTHRGTRAGAPRCVRDGVARRPRRRAAPPGGRRARSAGAHLRDGARPRPAGHGHRPGPGAAGCPPTRRRPRTSRWWSTPPCRRPRSRPRCATGRASCSSRSGCSTSTAVSRSGEGKASLAYALRFRAPDRTLTAEEASAARDAAVAEAARRTGAVQRS